MGIIDRLRGYTPEAAMQLARDQSKFALAFAALGNQTAAEGYSEASLETAVAAVIKAKQQHRKIPEVKRVETTT